MNMLERVASDHVIQWRRHIHQYPELSYKEVETTRYIESILDQFDGITHKRLNTTGVVATLQGAQPGKHIALRADIDALPIEEESDVTFPSQHPGIMHACGHDTHTAMLLGAVEVLAGMKESIQGTITFIFQAAEEVPPGGAKELVDLGVLDEVDFVFGLHVAPTIPVGYTALMPGFVTAASDTFHITIKGKGAHGSTPDLSVDPIMIGADIISSINNIVSRTVSPLDKAVISFGEFHAGQASNIIPDTAKLSGTVRTTRPEMRQHVKEQIHRIVSHVCEMYGADVDLFYHEGYSAIDNDPLATEIAHEAISKVIDPKCILEIDPLMGSEDFSAYTDVRPGAFFILGSGVESEGCGYINHHPKFKINEDCLPLGSALHAQIALDALN